MINIDDQVDKGSDWVSLGNHPLSSDPDTPLAEPIPSNNANSKIDSEGIEHPKSIVIQGKENFALIADALLQKCKISFDLYCSKSGTSLLINLPQYEKIFTELKNRNVKMRLITDITVDNLKYCKQIKDLFYVDLKHLEGTEGVFAIADNSLYITTSPLEDSTLVPELIYSNVKGIINQNKLLFETLWKKAVPAKQRIREIEKGLLPIETKILDTPEEIYTQITNLVQKTEMGVSICSLIGAFQLLDNLKPLLQNYKNLIKKHKEGKVKGGIRWITHIEDNGEQVTLIKKFLDFGIYIKHLKNIPSLTFGVSEKQFQSTIEGMMGGRMIESVLHSTEPSYIQHYRSVFEGLWNSALDAEERIRQIEEGIELSETSVIENSIQSKNILLQILEEAEGEIMIIFPSINSVKRQSETGLFNLIKLKNQQNIKIRILSPNVDIVKEILLLECSKEKYSKLDNVAVREIVQQQNIRSIVLMADKKHLLVIEVKDDSKETFEKATGFATYSTSKPTMQSYISIFETLWIQTEMFENIRVANEKLVESEEMEREFINTAAHELRTPTQAIMGYTELDKEFFADTLKNPNIMTDKEWKKIVKHLQKHYEVISRNASRLDGLINNLLDVARIESNRKDSLQLHKEILDLVKEIKDSIRTQLDQKIKDKNITINFINDSLDEHCWVCADKSRLNQIIINLIDNAIKFSKQNGKIDIIIHENITNLFNVDTAIKERIIEREHHNIQQIFVSVSDTGKGISPQIMPKVFEKFITGSDTGTGLGLFITKNIVEAHGGKIWAFNNNDRVGSTFVFNLPKADGNLKNN